MDLLVVVLLVVPSITGNPVTSSRLRARNDNSGLLTATHNACEDPDPNPSGALDVEMNATDLLEFLEHLEVTSMAVRDVLLNGTTHMEQMTHCQNIVNGMRALDITNFVTIETAMGEYQNDVTRNYFEMRQILYMFEILLSPRMEECCLHTSTYHHKLNHRIIGKWAILNRRYGQRIQDSHCCLSGTVELNRSLTCEIIRDLGYTILQEGVATINSSVHFLRNWTNGVDRS